MRDAQMLRPSRAFRRALRDDRGVLVTAAGLMLIGTITASAVSIVYNGGGAYVDNERAGLTEEAYDTRIGALKTQLKYFDERAAELKGRGDVEAAEKWERASKEVGTELTYTYGVAEDEVNRIRNARDVKVIKAGISLVPAAAPLAAEAKFLSVTMAGMTAIGEYQLKQQETAARGDAAQPPEPPKLMAAGRDVASDRKVGAAFPGRDARLVNAVGDYMADDASEEVQLESAVPQDAQFEEGAFMEALDERAEAIDPTQKTNAAANTLVMSPETQTELKSGKEKDALVLFKGENGLEPIIVSMGSNGQYSGRLVLKTGTPVVAFDSSMKMKEPPMPRRSKRSCPYLYAWNGRGFAAVNDLISVSRDPAHEYDDRLLFAAQGREDTLELRVAEVRDEESFIDAMSVSAVDAAAGFEPVVTPEGRVLSVARLRAPERVTGVRAAAVAEADGRGAKAFDGDVIEASWRVPDRSPAVLVLTVDGFEADSDEGRVLGKRPAIAVEAWRDGAWQPVSTVYPKDLSDTMAVDLSGRAEAGRLRVRLRTTSCHEFKYQLVDRIALSVARTDAVRVRAVPFRSAVLGGVDVRGALAVADGHRAHTVPGDVIRLECANPAATRYLITTRGWYRPFGQ